jgi:hypothetical protein
MRLTRPEGIASGHSAPVQQLDASQHISMILSPLRGVKTSAVLRNLGIAGVFSMLAGCSVGPKYTAPVVPVQPFHNVAPSGKDAAAPRLDTWGRLSSALNSDGAVRVGLRPDMPRWSRYEDSYYLLS